MTLDIPDDNTQNAQNFRPISSEKSAQLHQCARGAPNLPRRVSARPGPLCLITIHAHGNNTLSVWARGVKCVECLRLACI